MKESLSKTESVLGTNNWVTLIIDAYILQRTVKLSFIEVNKIHI